MYGTTPLSNPESEDLTEEWEGGVHTLTHAHRNASETVEKAAHVLLMLHSQVKAMQEGQVGQEEPIHIWVQSHFCNVLCSQDTIPCLGHSSH